MTPRPGTFVRQHMRTRIVDRSLNAKVGRTDHSPCSPGRASIFNGRRSTEHFNSKVSISEYYDYIANGRKDNHVYDNSVRYPGPIERDPALMAAATLLTANASDPIGLALLAQLPVNAADQPYGGTSSAVDVATARPSGTPKRTVFAARGDGGVGTAGNDDLQNAGGWHTWARAYGVDVYAIGKRQNGECSQDAASVNSVADPTTATAAYYDPATVYASGAKCAHLGRFYTSLAAGNTGHTPSTSPTFWTDNGIPVSTRRVPPAWNAQFTSADDLQDHYRYAVLSFDENTGGPNPADGHAQIGVQQNIQYDWEISTAGGGLTYSSGTGKVTLITAAAVTGMTAGMVFWGSVDCWSGTPIGGTNWVHPHVQITCVDSTHYTYTPLGTPTGTPTLTHAFLFVDDYFETNWYADRHINDILPQINVNDPNYKGAIVYHGFHMPHGSITHDGRNSNDIQAQRCYENTLWTAVPGSQALCWEGVQGQISPATNPADVDNGLKKTFYQRHNMFCSMDDALGRILDAWDAKFGVDGYYVIYVDDNGMQYGAHLDTETDAASPVGGKLYIWEDSVRVSIMFRGPGFEPGTQTTRLVELADIPATIMDLIGHPEHHVHTKGTGTSVLRKMAGEQATAHQWCRGKYLQRTAGGQSANHQKIIDPDGNTFVRLEDGTNRRLFLGNGAGSGEPDITEWETVDHLNDDAGTIALAATLEAILDDMIVGTWEPTLGVHTGKL